MNGSEIHLVDLYEDLDEIERRMRRIEGLYLEYYENTGASLHSFSLISQNYRIGYYRNDENPEKFYISDFPRREKLLFPPEKTGYYKWIWNISITTSDGKKIIRKYKEKDEAIEGLRKIFLGKHKENGLLPIPRGFATWVYMKGKEDPFEIDTISCKVQVTPEEGDEYIPSKDRKIRISDIWEMIDGWCSGRRIKQ